MNDPITHDQDAQARATMGATERACPEMVVNENRVYLSAYRALTLKVGETFSLDRPYGHPLDKQEQIVAFDGKDEHGYFRWKRESDGRVFLYTLPQSQRFIYYARPQAKP